MNKSEVAKKYLTPRDYEIWNRTQIKYANELKAIANDFGVSKQRIQVMYKKADDKVNILYDNLFKNEEI